MPGEGWAYHGSNYLVLRLVVEETTGMTLREALRERVLEPLRLERTDFVEGPLRGDCARGYLPADNPLLPGESEPARVRYPPTRPNGAATANSTPPRTHAPPARAPPKQTPTPERVRVFPRLSPDRRRSGPNSRSPHSPQ
ncbi:MAG: serine hydrolase [Gaiellaceae bacterium]